MQVVAINQLNFKSNDYKKENKNIERTNMSNDIKDIETFDSFESSDKKADKQPKRSISKFFNRLMVGLAFIGGVAGTPSEAKTSNLKPKTNNNELVTKINDTNGYSHYYYYNHDKPSIDSMKVTYPAHPERNKIVRYARQNSADDDFSESYCTDLTYLDGSGQHE